MKLEIKEMKNSQKVLNEIMFLNSQLEKGKKNRKYLETKTK